MTEKISPEISSKVIRALGGTSRVAKLCKVKAPSVSEWKTGGMPLYRYEYPPFCEDPCRIPEKLGEGGVL